MLDDEGEPVQGLAIQVSSYGYVNGQRQLTRSTSAQTNDLGEYRAYGIAPGKYYVSAVQQANLLIETAQKPPEEQFVTTYYPRTSDPAAASPLTLEPGAQLRDIDIRLVKVRTFTIRGRAATTGLPADTRLSLMLLPGSGQGIATRSASVLPDGTFEIRSVPPDPTC